MKKLCFFYFLIIFINLMPSIPLSIKGILGLVFIIFSSITSDLKGAIITTILLIFLQTFSYLMHFSVDYEDGTITMLLGTIVYFAIACFFGSYAENNRKMIQELKNENVFRNRIEMELKHQITVQNCLMNTVPMPLFFKDLNFNYVGINAAYSELLKIKEQDVIGKNAYQLYDRCIAEICDQMDKDLLSSQEKQVKEITICENDNTKSIMICKAIIKDDEGIPSGIFGVVIDITEQKESEKLKSNIAELRQEDNLKTEFFSNISHELRTPLNVIFSAVQLIEMSVNNLNYHSNQSKIKKNVMSIKQNCLRLQRLVNNLIDVSKIDAQAFELCLQNLDIVCVVEEITLSVADFITNKGIRLLFDTDIEEKIMAFDEEKMERIILNLLSNAIKFTSEGGVISVSIFDQDDSIIIRISDTGIGMPKDKLSEVFNRFYQISPVNTRSQEGSGIGLNLVKSLVEMHRGEISVESELGKGTVFSITLPCDILAKENQHQSNLFDVHSRIEKVQLEFSDIYNPIRKPAN